MPDDSLPPDAARPAAPPPDDAPTRLADRPLAEPHASRLPADHPGRAEAIAAHEQALSEGEAGYLDPVTGLFVLTAAFLAERGYCCQRGCRHCPYVGA